MVVYMSLERLGGGNWCYYCVSRIIDGIYVFSSFSDC